MNGQASFLMVTPQFFYAASVLRSAFACNQNLSFPVCHLFVVSRKPHSSSFTCQKWWDLEHLERVQNLWAFSNLCINRYPVTPTTYTFKAPSSPSVIGSFKETLRRAFGVLECKHMCRLGVGRGWGRVYRRSLSLEGAEGGRGGRGG